MIILPRWIEVNVALNKTTANADGEGLRYNLKPFLDVHITAYLLLVDILKIRTKRATLILIMSATFLHKTLFAKFFIVFIELFSNCNTRENQLHDAERNRNDQSIEDYIFINCNKKYRFRYHWKDCGYKIWYLEEIYCSWKSLQDSKAKHIKI